VTIHLRSAGIIDELIGEPDLLCSWICKVSWAMTILVPQEAEDEAARCEMVGCWWLNAIQFNDFEPAHTDFAQ
jgi:hypothetical protein